MPQSEEALMSRLRNQVAQGNLILFFGAGFSNDARDQNSQLLPDSTQLARQLYDIAFPGVEFEPETHLADAFQTARTRNPSSLRQYLLQRFSVDSATLPEYYARWFQIPWIRCYTLNIDDLPQAVSRRFSLPRPICSISATSGKIEGASTDSLEIIHLNGTISDDLDDVTFSDTDYAKRLTTPDVYWSRCASDMVAHPIVFVGTELDEPALWQYLEYRSTKGPPGIREMRPGSYLITPSLARTRQQILSELHIEWLPMSAEDFAASFLTGIDAAISEGHKSIQVLRDAQHRRSTPQLVSYLTTLPSAATEYLLGDEPTWDDLRAGRAIERECDPPLFEIAHSLLAHQTDPGPLLITGTAGTGKSTSLMRLALRLSDEGIPVYWVDEESNIEIHSLNALVSRTEGPLAILIDDADLFGSVLSGWARELPFIRDKVLFGMALRASKVEGLLDKSVIGANINLYEVDVPLLADPDIEGLLAVLDANNRLGVLKGKSHEKRVEAFRDQAGRQLLVAMIQATSGKAFKEKVYEEYADLNNIQQILYAIACVAYSQRYTLDREEMLLAAGSHDNVTLVALEELANRHLISRDNIYLKYRARHRVIADEIVSGLRKRDMMGIVLDGLSFAFAHRVRIDLPKSSRPWRRLIRFINHAFILEMASYSDGAAMYARLEPLLTWEPHYWLQRGSLEVEAGNLDLATHWLDQAISLAPEDPKIETEYSYLLMKKAATDPADPRSPDWFEEGKTRLEALIDRIGKYDSYPYHVLGSQGLLYARRAALTQGQKQTLLRYLIASVKSGSERHPRHTQLADLLADLRTDYLQTAVASTD